MVWSVPNQLTVLRIVLIPVFVVAYYLPVGWSHILTTVVFVVAALTDWWDGYLARRLNQHSALGAFLDPVADKLMVAVALVLLVSDTEVLARVYDHRLYAMMVAVIVGREITVSALREWMAELGQRARVAVSVVGKFKTTAQMFAIGFMLYGHPIAGIPIFAIGEWLFYAAAALTLWSMYEYLRAAWPKLLERE